jgi:hypothetical protein
MIEAKSVHYSEEDGAHKPGIPEDHAAFTAEPFLAPIVEARKMSVGRRRSANRRITRKGSRSIRYRMVTMHQPSERDLDS